MTLGASLFLGGCATHPISLWERLNPVDKLFVPATMPVAYPYRTAIGERLTDASPSRPAIDSPVGILGILNPVYLVSWVGSTAATVVSWPFVEAYELVTGRSPWPTTSFQQFDGWIRADDPAAKPPGR